MNHDRNDVCIVEIDALKERVSKVDDRLDKLNDTTRGISQSHIDILDRMDKKHRRVDSMENTLNELNVTVRELKVLVNVEKESVEKFRKNVDQISETLIKMEKLISAHDTYIVEQKQSKKDIITWFAIPVCSAIVAIIMKYFSR